MKRFVSFSVAAMMAAGITAGAACPQAHAAYYRPVVQQRNLSADEIWQQLLKQYGITNVETVIKPGGNSGCSSCIFKPGTGSGSGTVKPGTDSGSGSGSGTVNPGTGSGSGSGSGTVKPGTGSGSGSGTVNPGTGSGSNTGASSSYVSQVVALVNEARAQNGLSALKLDSRVSAAALTRASEIKTSFAHTRPDGRSCFTALAEAGVSYRGAGENIAYGQATPQAVMSAWMNSAGHRANILSNKYTTIGVGYTVIGGVPYWVQMFTY